MIHDKEDATPYGPEPQEHVPRPVMIQTWRSVAFLHWRYDPAVVQRLIPSPLEVDTHEGSAWVSLTPFLLTNLHPPGVPPLPWISTSPETNVRTYVRGPGGKRGIWFFSLDIGRLPAVLFGRIFYFLPYMWSDLDIDVSGAEVRYRGRRRRSRHDARYDIAVEVGEAFREDELTSLDHFLTAKWALYLLYRRVPAVTLARHQRWPLTRAKVTRVEQNLVEAAGLPSPPGEPLVHYAPGVDVRISRPYLLPS
ncbi:MAG: DUF2071 domain-containing protein [Actinomycetota bacterium]|nr:DUF2071 domain-containing protein [Actinomycetota bacterium]